MTVSVFRLDSVHELLLSSNWLMHQYLTREVAIEFMSPDLILHWSFRDNLLVSSIIKTLLHIYSLLSFGSIMSRSLANFSNNLWVSQQSWAQKEQQLRLMIQICCTLFSRYIPGGLCRGSGCLWSPRTSGSGGTSTTWIDYTSICITSSCRLCPGGERVASCIVAGFGLYENSSWTVDRYGPWNRRTWVDWILEASEGFIGFLFGAEFLLVGMLYAHVVELSGLSGSFLFQKS